MSQQMTGKLRIAVTGSTGLVGTRLGEFLTRAGHTVYAVRRGAGSPADARWNVETGEMEFPGPVDVLVHLAGRNVAARWSPRVKKEIRDSRVAATEKLCRWLAACPVERRPRRIVSASAVGIYGNRGDEVLTEESAPAAEGVTFLADVCRGWEKATQPARDAGMEVTHVRVGVVLSRKGGALAKLAMPTRLGLAGPVGSGMQFIPWISLMDMGRLIACAAEMEKPTPVINGVGPAPVRQHEFIRILAKVLHRPAIFPMPAFLVKLIFGQMGQEALLSSLRVVPTKLPPGFRFEHETLEAAIRAEME